MRTSDGGNVRWEIDDAGVLTVSGHGRTTEAGDATPWREYRDLLTRVRIQGDAGTEGIAPESTRDWFKLTNASKGGHLVSFESVGLDMSSCTSTNSMFDNCTKLTSLDVSGFDTSKVTDMSWMFDGCSSLTSLDVSGFDTSKVTDMSWMFDNCTKLSSLDVSGFDTSKVTQMSSMFRNCSSLTSLDVSGFDTSKVVSTTAMFDGCSSLSSLDVSGFDTSNSRAATWMFRGCSSLTSLDVSGFDTSNEGNFNSMFKNCSSLSSLDVSGFDTSKATGMPEMFHGCSSLTSLDVSGFDTSKVTDMGHMFEGCSSLSRIDLGARWAFKNGAGSLPEASSDDGHTGKWQAIGKGTADAPLGRALSASELMATYDGNTMADAYVWQPAFHLCYEANADDASGSTAPGKGAAGGTVAVSACGFTRPYSRFTRWNTEPDGSGTSYAPGDPFVLAARSQVLYAQWESTISKGLLVQSRAEGGGGLAGVGFLLAHSDDPRDIAREVCVDSAELHPVGDDWPQLSGRDGTMSLYGLKPGEYHVFNIRAAAGYQASDQVHVIKISNDGEVSLDGLPVDSSGLIQIGYAFSRVPALPSAGTLARVPARSLGVAAAILGCVGMAGPVRRRIGR